MKNVFVLFKAMLACCGVGAQVLSPNGYGGLGLLPSGDTIQSGQTIISFDTTVPGAPVVKGANTLIGFGLTNQLELVGRLATNDQKCNLFKLNDCPANSYRDFSSSVKWKLPFDVLEKNQTSLAIGATDFGGASTFFRSYYLVGTKKFEELDLTLGKAKAQVKTSSLDGVLVGATWRPTDWASVTIQRAGQSSSAHALVQSPVFDSSTTAWVTFNHRISDSEVMSKNWIGVGISSPLDNLQSPSTLSGKQFSQGQVRDKPLQQASPNDLQESLKSKGFYKVKISNKTSGVISLEIENSAYLWNALDAAGVALGVISSAYAFEKAEQEFDLILTTRGIKTLRIEGEAKCVGLWLSKGEACHKLTVQSLLQSYPKENSFPKRLAMALDGLDETITEANIESWKFRPEFIVSPVLISAIGTEYGAYDFDLGANLNAVLPLWTGATLETNRIEPLGVGTKQFEQGGVFYGARLMPMTNRKLFHQLVNLQSLNTQARFSAGTAYTVWEGRQIETSTQTDSGRHKFGYTGGSFKSNTSTPTQSERNYKLLNYRYVNNDQQTAVTELTQGKFWAGDKGFSINQRFWYGDNNLNLYFRRTRMYESQPLISFAGVQFTFPLTPRENKGIDNIGLRGVSQWTYALETKVLDKNNVITGGYGELPRIGESLLTTFNRDRNSSRYFDTNLMRIRDAYLTLGSN